MRGKGNPAADEFELLRQSAEAGDVAAQFALGQAYHRGATGIDAYQPTAIAWYFKAASTGHVEAQANLGAVFLEKAAASGAAGDADKARTWLNKAAAQGHVESMYHLGILMHQGYGMPQKSQAARGWLEAAANKGYDTALNQLGLMAAESGDHAQAAKWFAAGAERGDAHAQYSLARCLQDGNGVQRDPGLAAQWFLRAAEQDLPEAQYCLGLMMLEGEGIPRNVSQAQRWFQQAATRGEPNAQFEAAEGFRIGRGTDVDFGRALAFFRMAADQNHVAAQFSLGTMFESGTGLREPKLPDAAAMYRRAAIGGHRVAAHNYGTMLARGIGVTADRKFARKVLEFAISLGADEAMLTLGQLLMSEGDLVEAAQMTFLALQREQDGQGKRLLEAVRAHLPQEAIADAEKRAKHWRRKPVSINWD